MFVDKEKWSKLKDYFCDLYWEQDRLSQDGKYFLSKLNNLINSIDRTKSEKVYVITNNAIVDDEIDYSIYGVSIDKENAKKLFKQAVKNVKCDSDFENLEAIDVSNNTKDTGLEEWYYEESDNSFELYLNGEYNSNNFSVRINEFDIEKELDRERDKDNYEL